MHTVHSNCVRKFMKYYTYVKYKVSPAIYSSPRLYYTKYCRRVSVARHSLNVNEEYNFNNIYVLYLTLYHHVYSVNLRYISCSEWCSVAENHLLRLQPIILGAAHLRGKNSKHTNKQQQAKKQNKKHFELTRVNWFASSWKCRIKIRK